MELKMEKATRVQTSYLNNNIITQENQRFSGPKKSRIFLESKRSQMKIQQMAFMLMAVILFFILVGLFWLSIQSISLRKDVTRLGKEQAIIISSMLGDSGEFTCGSYCVDTDKILVLKENDNRKKVYRNFWPVAYIEIRKIEKGREVECTKENYPNCNLYTVYDSGKKGIGEGSFVALCRKENYNGFIYTKCELGRLIIGYEKK